MKHLNPILTLAAVAAFAAGCVKDPMLENGHPDGMIPLNIDGTISQVQTKVTASGFSDKDAIGLFAVNYSEGNTVPGTLLLSGNQADNAKYIYNEAELKWKSTRSVYYKDVYTNADLYLYYPYQTSIDNINSYNFEVKADQNVTANGAQKSGYELSDFLWGKAENVVPTESKVPVLLKHIMSSASVTLKEGTGFSEGEWDDLAKSIVVTNTTLKSQINFATGIVTPVGGATSKGIVMTDQEDGSFRAIVVPQEVEASLPVFAITIGSSSYGFKTDGVTRYVSGKMSTFDITVSKKNASGEYELTLTDSQITNWVEDRNSHGGEARQYFVVNVTNKGELGKTIKKENKHPDRIKNLKITGEIDGSDFMFMRDSMKILEAVNLKECRVFGAYSGESIAWFEETWDWDNLDNYINQYGQPDRIWRSGEDGHLCYEWYRYKDWGVIPVNAFSEKKSLTYFVFPEDVKIIASCAFRQTGLSGALIIPDNVTEIGNEAFYNTNISSVSFGDVLRSIGGNAFSNCSALSGELLLPESITKIEGWCFYNCHFSGHLTLPESLETLGDYAFYNSGTYNGDLEIPERLYELLNGTFQSCTFAGSLDLKNVTAIGASCFNGCNFRGELVLPEGITEIGEWAFGNNAFSSICFPSSLKRIANHAFAWNPRLNCDLIFPEGLISIGDSAFSEARGITSIELPSTIQSIQSNAFSGCYYVSRFICNAVEPPIVQNNAFNGIAKDNFTLEVPAQSVKRYQSEIGWSDFKRIASHYDFSISRRQMRGLNDEISRTYVLRAPSGYNWSVKSKPEWVTVSPSSGTGKADVTVTFSQMDRTYDQFLYKEHDQWGNIYDNYACGRAGEIVFELDGKDYTSTMTVEQFDSDYSDEDVRTFQTASKGAGIDIVFLGDGYDAKDIATGKFYQDAEEGFGHFFDVEPYKTYQDYFNVYAVVAMSDDSGIGTVNTVNDTRFGTYFTQNRLLPPDMDLCFEWSRKANPSLDETKSLTIMLMNTSTYEGITMMGYDNSAVACCPVSREPYPYDFRGIIQHEAGGHGFGKLADEYIYHNAFIQTCSCDCCDHPQSDDDLYSNFGFAKYLGWYKNLTMKSNASQVPWAHLIYNENYSDYVDMYEGGYMHSRGMFRSEATSCMNNNIPYFSAISRQAIVERIMEYAGIPFSLEDFYSKDKDSFGPVTKSAAFDRTFGVDPDFVRASERAPIFVDRK